MRIEYEDKDIIIIYKEAGLPVQSGKTSRKDLVSMLKNHLAQEAGAAEVTHSEEQRKHPAIHKPQKSGTRPGEIYLGIVHRLDQPVEGLLVFAKNPKSAASLSAQAAAKDKMEKVYRAVVCLDSSSYPLVIDGMKREITLTDWIGRDYSSNTAYVASEDEKDAKKAELVFRTLWIRESRALLEIRLLTGRHHQIRVQMAHAGMPILGDRKYGDPERTALPSEEERKAYPLCLCACRLSFYHPVSGKKMEFSTEPAFSDRMDVL